MQRVSRKYWNRVSLFVLDLWIGHRDKGAISFPEFFLSMIGLLRPGMRHYFLRARQKRRQHLSVRLAKNQIAS